MKANRDRRLQAESKQRMEERRSRAGCRVDRFMEKLGLTQHERAYWPSDEELLSMEPLASFLQSDADIHCSDTESSDDESHNDKASDLDDMDRAIIATQETVRRALDAHDLNLAHMITSANASTIDKAQRILSLATSVLVVDRAQYSKTETDVNVYFGREVLLAVRYHIDWIRSQPFSDTPPATFSPVGRAAVQQILKLCKLKDSTTTLELDTHDAHFVCIACKPIPGTPDGSYLGKKVPCRQVLSWRTAVCVATDDTKCS